MAEFHEIGSSQFTETTSPTGEEMIQISATQKVKLKTIITALIRYGLTTTANGAYPGDRGNINRTILESFGLTTVSGVNTNLTRTATQNKLAFKSRSRKDKTNAFGDEAENLNVFFEVATRALAGLMSAADKVKLDGSILGSALVVAAKALAAGTAPTVKWDNSSNTLTFGIPKGDKGDKGDAGSSSSTDMKMTGWTNITKYGDVQDPYIQASDTLLDAIRKLSWMTGNNTVKVFGGVSGVGMMWWDGDTVQNIFNAFYLEIKTLTWYIIFKGQFSRMGENATNEDIINYIVSNGTSIYLADNYQEPVEYSTNSSPALTIGGGSSVWYTGTQSPSVTVNGSGFSEKKPTAFFWCPYNLTPIFSPSSNTALHVHKNYADVRPTSGYKAYTLYCQKVSGIYQILINVAPYN